MHIIKYIYNKYKIRYKKLVPGWEETLQLTVYVHCYIVDYFGEIQLLFIKGSL